MLDITEREILADQRFDAVNALIEIERALASLTQTGRRGPGFVRFLGGFAVLAIDRPAQRVGVGPFLHIDNAYQKSHAARQEQEHRQVLRRREIDPVSHAARQQRRQRLPPLRTGACRRRLAAVVAA